MGQLPDDGLQQVPAIIPTAVLAAALSTALPYIWVLESRAFDACSAVVMGAYREESAQSFVLADHRKALLLWLIACEG